MSLFVSLPFFSHGSVYAGMTLTIRFVRNIFTAPRGVFRTPNSTQPHVYRHHPQGALTAYSSGHERP
jgi:hypothetical protein